MSKTLDFNSLLTKLANVFKTDMYIYEYKFCIGGKYSEADNEGQILCTLNPEYEEMMKTLYKSDYIFFSDIKKAKKEPETYISVVTDEFTQHLIKKQYKSLVNNIERTGKWRELTLSEADIIDIFVDRNLHTFFTDDESVPKLDLVKTSFPLLSEKNAGETTIMYKSFGKDEETEIATIVISYVVEWFQIQEYLMYFEL